MSDHVLMEEPLRFGEGRRFVGILTLSGMRHRDARESPVFVFLSAGLLHRVGPHRLHVRLARELAQMGFSSLRVDLAGTGDNPPRPGLTDQQSVAADFEETLALLDSRLGRLPLVLFGMCAGADNAIRLTLKEPRVVGMVLLDPFCFVDWGFRSRVVVAKYTNPARYIAWLKRCVMALTGPLAKKQKDGGLVETLALRDVPSREQLRAAFESIRERDGRALSIFTRYALGYYNQKGQLGRVLGVNGYEQFCSELFWPQVHHTYPVGLHQRRLSEVIKTWAGNYIRP